MVNTEGHTKSYEILNPSIINYIYYRIVYFWSQMKNKTKALVAVLVVLIVALAVWLVGRRYNPQERVKGRLQDMGKLCQSNIAQVVIYIRNRSCSIRRPGVMACCPIWACD